MIRYYTPNIRIAVAGNEFPFYILFASGRARSVAALESFKPLGNLLNLRLDKLISGINDTNVGSRHLHISGAVSEQLLTVLAFPSCSGQFLHGMASGKVWNSGA
jgi:hypothetical protein